MDFLDPKAKKRHKIRLMIGYVLMAILILTTSSILVFSAYGFDVDRKTGSVIQNGLLFVDSAPDGAQVVLNNNIQKDKTNNRFSLPEGNYSLKIQKEGYRDWTRTFSLTGGEVERFTYPLLIPTNLSTQLVQTYDAAPAFVTESPDRRWVLASQADSLTSFTEYDLNTLIDPNQSPQVRTFSLPATLFTAAEGAHSIQPIEWSTDNKHILVKHTFATGFEYVVISRDQPATSININQLLALNPTSISLRDKKFDQWYIYTQEGGVLQTADAKKAVASVATGVVAYKSHDNDTILYATTNADMKTTRITLKQGNDSYKIRDVAAGAVMLDIARYDNQWYVVVGSDADQKSYIYKNPVDTLRKKDGSLIGPVSILKTTGPMTWVSFSQNTRFIVTQSAQHFEVYDAEYKQSFQYDIGEPIDADTPVTWIDGHRLAFRTKSVAHIIDFDGSNKQTLVGSIPNAPLIFDRDYTVMYNIQSADTTGKTSLMSSQLRLPGDK